MGNSGCQQFRPNSVPLAQLLHPGVKPGQRQRRRRGGLAWLRLGLTGRVSEPKPEREAGPGWVLPWEGPRAPQCGGRSPSRDRAGPLGNAVPRPGRRASRPRHSKRLGAAAGTLGSSLTPRREGAPTRRQAAPRPSWSPTAYSPGGEILLHAQQPLAQGLQHRVASLQASRRRGYPHPPDAVVGRPRPPAGSPPHTAVAAPSASPPPSARARPAQPQCSAQGSLPLPQGAGLCRRARLLRGPGRRRASSWNPAFSGITLQRKSSMER